MIEVHLRMLCNLFGGSTKTGGQNLGYVLWFGLLDEFWFFLDKILLFGCYLVFCTKEGIEWVHNWVEIFFNMKLVLYIDLKNGPQEE